MDAPKDVDRSLSLPDLGMQEFNCQVEELIAEYKKKHPDFFIEETRLFRESIGALFDIIVAAYAPGLELDQEQREDYLDSSELRAALRLAYKTRLFAHLRLANMEPLLDIIVTTHAPGLNLDQDQRESYLESNELQDALKLAYKTRSFADLRNNPRMPFVAKGRDEATTKVPMRRGDDPGLKSAFEQPYRGQADQLLIHTLNRYRREGVQATEPKDRPYNWAIPVIQSSGMGKSRMVDQAAESVFTIPINIREETPGVLTFPPSDRQVRGYFEAAKSKPDTAVQAAYAIFLTVLFDKAAKATQLTSGGEKGVSLAANWAKYLKGRHMGGAKTARDVFLDEVVKEAENLRDSSDSSSLTAIFQEMKDKCRALVELVSDPNTETDRTNACFVYFDEAHGLTEPVRPYQQRRTPYHNLGAVLVELRDLRVFFIFISTNSHIQQFAPSTTSYSSTQAGLGPRLFPPFTELPFDVFVDVVAQNQGMRQRSGHSRTWYAHHKTWQTSKRGNHVLTFARMKLANGLISETWSQSRLAALGVGTGISFDLTTQSSREKESALVESHMRVVYAVPEHGEFMHAGSPSEPIIAEAAAQYLDESSKSGRIQHLGPKVLSKACMASFLARGERGELCARLLMTVAHDMALQEHFSKPGIIMPLEEPCFHRPVPVLDFLRALFAEEHHPTVLHAKSVTRKEGGATLEEAFKDSFVCFSHFALAGDSEMLRAHNPASALVRGMAIQAKDNQLPIDAVIPIHMGPVTSRITPRNTSAINLQVNNYKCPEFCHVDRKLSIWDLAQPVISIIIDFGDDASSSQNTVTVQDIPPSPTHNKGSVHCDDSHYEIVARGRGSKVFKAIPESAEQYYNMILAETGLLEDFARKDSEQNQEGLYALKPAFRGGGMKEWEARNPDLA